MPSDKRRHPRTPIQMTVQLSFKDGYALTVQTWDISDGGIGIDKPDDNAHQWVLGEKLTAQIQGLPVPAPEVDAEIIRIDEHRVGIKLSP